MPRPSGRKIDDLRQIELIPGFSKHAEGSCLAKFGDTHVLCTATVEERVPGDGADATTAGDSPSGARFVIDSWFREHGEPAVVLPLADWLDGDGPNVP